jgi:hypothetical protein
MANKTIIQVPIKKTDLQTVSLTMVMEEKTWNAIYAPKDETGAPISTESRSCSGTVTADPGLWAWIDNVVIPAINAQEGTA